MSVRVLLATTVAALMVAGAANATVNLASDGNFTVAPAPPSSPGFQTYFNGSTLGAGSPWKVTRGSVDLVDSVYWNGPTGARSVDIDGNTAGTIQQDINFAKPGDYVLTFKISGNPDNFSAKNPASNLKQILVSIGDQQGVTESYTVTSSSHTLSYDLVTLKFHEDSAGPDSLIIASYKTPGAYGAVIGDFSVVGVPEPATWGLMLVGFGGLGAALRMNRRRSVMAAA